MPSKESSATDYLTDVTDVTDVTDGSSATDYLTDVTDVTDVTDGRNRPQGESPIKNVLTVLAVALTKFTFTRFYVGKSHRRITRLILFLPFGAISNHWEQSIS